MQRIAIDMDEVIADVRPKFLSLYEREFGRPLVKEEYWGKKVYQLPGAAHIRECLHEKGFFAGLPVIPGSQECIRELMERYEVFIVTAAMEFRASFEDKFDWLQEHFPFIHWKNIVFCGDKSIISANYMIDDHAFNLEHFQGKGLLYTASHNVHETRFTRVDNWEDIRAFFRAQGA
ncbi:MAG: 5'(3')-deoxyribonucleotidase [Phaeodactylibacter sp.]|nr:5'(3')-deoxyribonucleotidase [Phaeodactylibacter sp.]MCB9275641.1 5'(3')-deoxyribonucleotidase [Lewinellaceae bacterium]